MKKLFFTFLLASFFLNVNARHIKGGFINYKYIGPGSAANTLRYKITLTVYMTCGPLDPMQVTNPIHITIFNGNGPSIHDNVEVFIANQYQLGKSYDEPCITDDQKGCYYTIVVYELNNYDLPISANGYTVSYQRCCRIANMDNVQGSEQVGNTYTTKIPGTSSPIPDANKNSSPDFSLNDTAVICSGSFFSFPLAATDLDGDSLSYALCGAFQGGSTLNPVPDPAESPGYNTLVYESPYEGYQPMGPSVKIDAKTGLLSGIAPPIALTGEYVVTVCVSEYRKGLFLGESRKELHVRVKDCIPLKALLNPKPVTCDGFNIQFSNDVENISGTNYEWNFGDTLSGIKNTSTAAIPSHTYTDTGVYTVKLKVSIAGLCADSTTTIVKVYPGFFPGFITNPPYCRDKPVQFTDTTKSKYGIPTGWHWDFGDSVPGDSVLNDPAPFYIYKDAGTYNVTLIVGNTKGCIDTVTSQVTIAENPTLSVLPKDTSYCSLDTLTLTATGTGAFNWAPAVNIIGANTSTPKVFPSATTKYFVTLTSNGCTNRDSVTLRPVNNVTNSISTLSNNVCEGDTITLNGSSNYSTDVRWQWNPAAAVFNPTAQSAQAIVTANGQFILTTRWGNNCLVSDTQNITVKPLAIANAGRDTFICKGQNSTVLQASGGISYQWTPTTGLSNPNSPAPVASPGNTTPYIVAVAVAGCSATRKDTVIITVRDLPPTNLTNDTLICSIDTMQLRTNAAGTFVWTPNYNISNLTSPNPLISPDVPTRYFVRLTDPFGCVNTDSVFVDVKLFVTINAGTDTTICRTDGFKLNTTSDALSYQWSPSAYLDDDKAKQPVATPTVPEITYTVIGNIGKCQSRDVITIKTAPYPIPDAGIEARVCYGVSTQLSASGGRNYSWSPAVFLNNPNIANPTVVNPTVTTTYKVAVTDVLGCPKPVTDSVTVFVRNPVQATTGVIDTSIVIGETLQMNGSGGEVYSWSPAIWLSNPSVPNPLASPEDDIEYKLTVTTVPEGCIGRDTLKVKVFKVPPSFYVPTAFSPNGDGLNEVLRPKALGMKSVKYFRVFNRAGQLLFATTERNKGWDGTYKGNPQDPGTYVWAAEGVTYKGESIVRKGTAVLIK
jgi:gliding motility-associated-like protein